MTVDKHSKAQVCNTGSKLDGELGKTDVGLVEELKHQLSLIEQRMENAMNAIEDGYAEADLEGNLIYFNPAFARMLEFPVDCLQGMNYRAYVSKTSQPAVFKAFHHVFQGGDPIDHLIFDIQKGDGLAANFETSVSLIRNPAGEKSGFRGIIQDITRRCQAEQELENSRSRLEAIFQSVRDAIITVDQHGRVMDCNQAAEAVCGISTLDANGKLYTELQLNCQGRCREVLNQTLEHQRPIQDCQIDCGKETADSRTVSVSSSPLLSQDGTVKGAVLVVRDMTRLRDLEKKLEDRHRYQNIIGRSRKMRAVYELLENLTDVDTTVLITGGSGTGKEMVARALHFGGCRRTKPFISVNCSALADNLLESELFGHVKGAYTGAISSRQGRFQMADSGTILLDEIGEIPLRTQVKLLRVLQEKSFEPVGDAKPVKVDVRVIACTNQDLKQQIQQGRFREDLFYRLKVVEIQLPSLKERREDIPLLIEHFVDRFNQKFNKQILGTTTAVLDLFMQYDWPGNVRELEHTLEHAFVLCKEPLIAHRHLPLDLTRLPTQKESDHAPAEPLNAAVLQDSLHAAAGNKTQAARQLGISRRTLYRKLAQFGLS